MENKMLCPKCQGPTIPGWNPGTLYCKAECDLKPALPEIPPPQTEWWDIRTKFTANLYQVHGYPDIATCSEDRDLYLLFKTPADAKAWWTADKQYPYETPDRPGALMEVKFSPEGLKIEAGVMDGVECHWVEGTVVDFSIVEEPPVTKNVAPRAAQASSQALTGTDESWRLDLDDDHAGRIKSLQEIAPWLENRPATSKAERIKLISDDIQSGRIIRSSGEAMRRATGLIYPWWSSATGEWIQHVRQPVRVGKHVEMIKLISDDIQSGRIILKGPQPVLAGSRKLSTQELDEALASEEIKLHKPVSPEKPKTSGDNRPLGLWIAIDAHLNELYTTDHINSYLRESSLLCFETPEDALSWWSSDHVPSYSERCKLVQIWFDSDLLQDPRNTRGIRRGKPFLQIRHGICRASLNVGQESFDRESIKAHLSQPRAEIPKLLASHHPSKAINLVKVWIPVSSQVSETYTPEGINKRLKTQDRIVAFPSPEEAIAWWKETFSDELQVVIGHKFEGCLVEASFQAHGLKIAPAPLPRGRQALSIWGICLETKMGPKI